MKAKVFIGPMTKNVVDGAIQFEKSTTTEIAFIPSRRQVEVDGGYVNNWTTESFCNYVKSRCNARIVRDHAGPAQGKSEDDGVDSIIEDCKHMHTIHIDPWKVHRDIEEGAEVTSRLIKMCHIANPNMTFEIGTEQSIRKFEPQELVKLTTYLTKSLTPEEFERIEYLVIQSGTSLRENTQTGNYSTERLRGMLDVARRFGLKSKEHNGDYIDEKTIIEKFDQGLDCINIAPEFGLIETDTYLQEIDDNETFELFWKVCHESRKWEKWVSKDFNPLLQKKELIRICGHYVLSTPEFSEIRERVGDVSQLVMDKVEKKLRRLHGL